jgi:hypothetical protein
VSLALHNVLNVKTLLKTVPFVSQPEKIPQTVNVHSDNTLTTTKISVKIVPSTVNLVITICTIVESVKVTESPSQIVSAHTDTSKITLYYVQNVLINVILVKVPKKPVPFVLKTEFIFLSVPAHTDIITLISKLTAQLVTKNVNLVSKPPITVSNVLKDSSNHHSVSNQNQPPTPSKLKKLLSVPPTLSTANSNVELVKVPQITVLLVLMSTELNHQNVHVKTDTTST